MPALRCCVLGCRRRALSSTLKCGDHSYADTVARETFERQLAARERELLEQRHAKQAGRRAS